MTAYRIGQDIRTNSPEFPMIHLTRIDPARHNGDRYGVMMLSRDPESGKACGWFFIASGDLKHCRERIRHYVSVYGLAD